MASIGEDLRTFIINKSSTELGASYVASRVHQNVIPETQLHTYPRVWFERTGREQIVYCGGGKADSIESRFDIECISDDLDQSLNVAAAMWVHLNGARGALTTAAGAVVSRGAMLVQQDDDYIPKGIADDSGLHVSALSLHMFHST